MLLTIYQIQYVSSFVLPFHNNKTICSINYGYIIKHNYVKCYSYQIRFIITCRGLKTNFHFNFSKKVNIYSEKANSYITCMNKFWRWIFLQTNYYLDFHYLVFYYMYKYITFGCVLFLEFLAESHLS